MTVLRHTVDLWTLSVPDEIPEADLDRCRSLLSEDELARGKRFRIASKRAEFFLSHAFVRCVLSRYRAASPRDWRFVSGPLGRPEIEGEESGGLRFNLSHTGGLLACSVAETVDVGVDVEMAGRDIDLQIADRYFSPYEATHLRQLDPAGQKRRFFELWTMKEAYLKARGAGLHLPLDGFSIEFEAGAPIGIRFDPQRIADDPSSWRVHQYWLSARHVLGCAVKIEATAQCHFQRQTLDVHEIR